MNYKIALILFVLPNLALAGSVHETRHMELSAKGIHLLEVNCGAGLLDIKSVDGLRTIKIAAEIEVEDFKREELQKFIEKNVRLHLEKRNKIAHLQSEIETSPMNNLEARINLEVAIPGKMDVKIIDGSGPIMVKGLLGKLKIDDDSGTIEIENITGSVNVDDGSGSILIENIRGNVAVKDGSGLIELDYINGDVLVTDGTGDMVIRHIEGNVTVSDGSGDIDISDVSGNVFITEAGSGALDIERVKGKITTRE